MYTLQGKLLSKTSGEVRIILEASKKIETQNEQNHSLLIDKISLLQLNSDAILANI